MLEPLSGAPREVAPGVWYWTAPHPEWEPGAEPESPADWPREVGSVLYESPDGVAVFVDPQLPPDEEAFWRWADERVAGGPVLVLTTIRWHERSRAAIAARYPAAAAAQPAGVETLPFPEVEETMVWLAHARALVPGDRLIGTPGGGLRLCPQSWLAELATVAELRSALQPLLDLPVEHVLVSHGEPVLHAGAEALASALR